MKKFDINSLKPSREQLDNLLEHYQTGRYVDAEKLSLLITQEFPKHQFAWKVLGAALKQMGKINESLAASQKSVQLNQQDSEAHNNLGNTLQELGRLDEAEASYRQAITLKPDYAEAHNNLGVTLKELGRLDEACSAYIKAINLNGHLHNQLLMLSLVCSLLQPHLICQVHVIYYPCCYGPRHNQVLMLSLVCS